MASTLAGERGETAAGKVPLMMCSALISLTLSTVCWSRGGCMHASLHVTKSRSLIGAAAVQMHRKRPRATTPVHAVRVHARSSLTEADILVSPDVAAAHPALC